MTSEYAFGDCLVCVDGGVIEQFARTVAGSYRVPVAWASAEFARGSGWRLPRRSA